MNAEEDIEMTMLEKHLRTDAGKLMCTACRSEMETFLKWKDEVDCEQLLSDFDLTLAWFSAKGFDHSTSINAATYVREELGGTP